MFVIKSYLCIVVRSHVIELKLIKQPIYLTLDVRPQMMIYRLFYFMNFLEKDLEQIIYEADKELLAEKGLRINGKLLRQVKIGNYGIADLVSIQRPFRDTIFEYQEKGLITIYELKKDNISVSAFLQGIGYAKGIMRWMEQHPKKLKCLNIENYDINIVLIGKNIDKSSEFIFLNDLLDSTHIGFVIQKPFLSVEMFTYEYDINGIYFKQHIGYKKINEGFKYE